MASTVVRVEETTHAKLNAWSEAQKKPISQIVRELVDHQEAELFWAAMHEDFDRLRADPVAWKDYQDEARIFEGGSMDGLEDDEPYYTVEEEAEIEKHARSQGW
ncbi:MAG TPA: hypothetical protein VFQ54_04905 [Thermomicrobiales bacterium]|nr:hypothetical protein [Thermomicrobiales bacterium]